MAAQADIICYYNDGLSFRPVPYNYVAQIGEVVFPSVYPPTKATFAQLSAAFPNFVTRMNQASATAAGDTALEAGVNLTSTSTPELNGTYEIDSAAVAKINAVETYILRNSTFPGSLSSLPWQDTNGDMHTFPSTTLFSQFATEVANYVTLVTLYRDSGGEAGSLPSSNISIS